MIEELRLDLREAEGAEFQWLKTTQGLLTELEDTIGRRSDTSATLHAMSSAPDLAAARELLMMIGFQPISQ